MHKTLVIVDDFKTNIIVMKHALEQRGFKVLEADNPNDALKYFDGRDIHLMITDFKMPGMTGAELTKSVKSINKYQNLPVLILSSETAEYCKIDARKAGAYGWLKKPFEINRFLKIIESVFK